MNSLVVIAMFALIGFTFTSASVIDRSDNEIPESMEESAEGVKSEISCSWRRMAGQCCQSLRIFKQKVTICLGIRISSATSARLYLRINGRTIWSRRMDLNVRSSQVVSDSVSKASSETVSESQGSMPTSSVIDRSDNEIPESVEVYRSSLESMLRNVSKLIAENADFDENMDIDSFDQENMFDDEQFQFLSEDAEEEEVEDNISNIDDLQSAEGVKSGIRCSWRRTAGRCCQSLKIFRRRVSICLGIRISSATSARLYLRINGRTIWSRRMADRIRQDELVTLSVSFLHITCLPVLLFIIATPRRIHLW
ncbi:unnamed protein product [Acanthosepion pharaonis]|uniref:Uncharacterized protein n=1 Tax=Acanthosepion pharaonis TaxID=158019 RepID=A0A812BPB1_ACAPH|nr:unnamed protein product [Sepia pharaonis]